RDLARRVRPQGVVAGVLLGGVLGGLGDHVRQLPGVVVPGWGGGGGRRGGDLPAGEGGGLGHGVRRGPLPLPPVLLGVSAVGRVLLLAPGEGPVVLHLSQQLVQCLLVPVVVGGGRAIVEVPVIVHLIQDLADPVLIAALVASWPAQAVILAAVRAAQIAAVLA